MSSIHSVTPMRLYHIKCAPAIEDSRRPGKYKLHVQVEGNQDATIAEIRRLIATELGQPFEEVHLVSNNQRLETRNFVRVIDIGATSNAYFYEDDKRWSTDYKLDQTTSFIVYFGRKKDHPPFSIHIN